MCNNRGESETIDAGYASASLLVCAGATGNGKSGVKERGANTNDKCIMALNMSGRKCGMVSGDALEWFRIILRFAFGLMGLMAPPA